MVVVRAFRLFLVLMFLTGVIYPAGITIMAEALFPSQAAGTILQRNGISVGSVLLAQKFESPAYFHTRPSACDFNTVPAGASNQGPTSRMLKEVVQERAARLLPFAGPVPPDLLLASGSGLDPHITPASVAFQMDRVARTRRFSPDQRARLQMLAEGLVEPPQFGFLGEARVNVLLLNIAVDGL